MDGVMLCDMLRILTDNVDPIKIAVELQGLIVVEKGVYRRWRECNSSFDKDSNLRQYLSS